MTDGTVTPGNFASVFLQRLGLPTSQAWQDVVNAWVTLEGGYSGTKSGGAAVNNPLNANCDWPGQTGCVQLSNGAKVGVYGSLSDAVNSYASGGGINNFEAWKKAASPAQLAKLITDSNWAAGHYGSQKAIITTSDGKTITLTGIQAWLYKNGSQSDTTKFVDNYGAGKIGTGGDATLVGFNPFENIIPGLGALGDLFGGIAAKSMGDLLVTGSFLVLGFAMVIIGLKALVSDQSAGEAMRSIASSTAALTATAATGGVSVIPQVAAMRERGNVPVAQPPIVETVAPSPGIVEFSPETPRATSEEEDKYTGAMSEERSATILDLFNKPEVPRSITRRLA